MRGLFELLHMFVDEGNGRSGIRVPFKGEVGERFTWVIRSLITITLEVGASNDWVVRVKCSTRPRGHQAGEPQNDKTASILYNMY